MLTLGFAWSAFIAGEYVGIEGGLDRILTFAQFMSQTGRMSLVGLLLLAYASVGYFMLQGFPDACSPRCLEGWLNHGGTA